MKKVYIEKLDNIKINDNLPDFVTEYLKRYKNKNRLMVSKKAYSLLVEKLKCEFDFDFTNEKIILNEYNKPYFYKNKDIYFNISHSKDFVAIVISDKECGIDIEYVDSNKKLNISKRIMSEKELTYFNNTNEKLDYLIKLWTIKEAYYKCVGIGIDLAIIRKDNDYSSVTTTLINDNNNKYYVSVDA